MRKKGLIQSLLFFTFAFVLTFGLLVHLPADLNAAATDELAGASAPAEAEGEANPDDVGGASANLDPLPHYEPLPVEPIHQEANNVLLGSGLGAAVLIIGGSIMIDKRKY